MDIVSVQSRVAWGYVGNAVAVPTIQAFGLHVWPVDTVRLAHHPGHGKATPVVTPPSELAETLAAVLARASQPLLLLGYLGAADQGPAVLEAAAAAGTPLVVDPAFGDTAEGTYVKPDIVDFYRHAVREADWALPNAYELSILSGRTVGGLDDAVAAAKELLSDNGQGLVVTSVPDGGKLANLLVTRDTSVVARVNARKLRAKGTGDMLSAAFCAGLANGRKPAEALADAVAVVDIAVRDAEARDATELDMPEILLKIGARANRTRTHKHGPNQ